MSVSTATKYKVVSAAELERRRNEEIESQCRTLLTQVIAEYAAVKDKDAEAIVRKLEPNQKNASTLAKWKHELQYMHQTAKTAVAAKKQQQSQKRLEKVFSDNAKRIVKLGITDEQTKKPVALSTSKNRKTAKQIADTKAFEQIHASIKKALTLASEIEDDNLCAEFGKDAARIAQIEDASAAKGSLKIFQAEVERAIRQQQKRRSLNEQKDKIILSLSHINSQASAEIITGLVVAENEDTISTLAVRAAELIDENTRIENAAYVAKQVKEVLDELGNYSSYGGQSGDDSEKTSNIVIQRNDFPEHVLRIQIDSERGVLRTNIEYITASGYRSSKNAKDVEEAICPDITMLQELLVKSGIETTWIRQNAPGEVKMKEYTETKIKAGGKGKTKEKTGQATGQITQERKIGND